MILGAVISLLQNIGASSSPGRPEQHAGSVSLGCFASPVLDSRLLFSGNEDKLLRGHSIKSMRTRENIPTLPAFPPTLANLRIHLSQERAIIGHPPAFSAGIGRCAARFDAVSERRRFAEPQNKTAMESIETIVARPPATWIDRIR